MKYQRERESRKRGETEVGGRRKVVKEQREVEREKVVEREGSSKLISLRKLFDRLIGFSPETTQCLPFPANPA